MKFFAIGLYVLSIIVAITLSAKVVPKGQWPENMPIFIGSVIVAVISLILWHRENRKEVKEMLATQDTLKGPLAYLQEGQQLVEQLEIRDDYLAQVDKVSEGPFFEFIEQSRKLMDIYGQERGAEIILSFAQIERYLNRSWSAYSDGHQEETKRSLEQAKTLYRNLMEGFKNV